jgi:co-chaperonin GroES (HSP10)
MNCKLKPRKNFIIVKEQIATNKVGMIALADNVVYENQRRITEGEIIAKGPTAFEGEEDQFPIGQIVRFEMYAGQALEFNKVFYRILVDDEVIATSDSYLNPSEDLIDG